MTTFGGHTVTFVGVTTAGTPGYLGLKAESRSSATVVGCRARQLSSSETDGQPDVASEVWKFTLPPVAAALAAAATGEITYEGKTFLIDGPPAPKYNMDGTVHHVTVLAKRQDG